MRDKGSGQSDWQELCCRRSVKSRAQTDGAESLEDTRIWATDMSPGAGGGGGHYEKINMQSVAGSQQYESIRNMQTQVSNLSSYDDHTLLCILVFVFRVPSTRRRLVTPVMWTRCWLTRMSSPRHIQTAATS